MNWNGSAISIGAALVDLLLCEDEAYLAQLGSPKGGMTLVSAEELQNKIALSSGEISRASGGSSCNTAIGLAQLGVPSKFFGRIGQDETGDFFAQSLNDSLVRAELVRVSESTGQVLSVITPDAQRTMFTSLAASAGLIPQDLDRVDWSDVALVHLEGYLAFNPPFFQAVLAKAQAMNLKVSLDLSSFEVVRFCRPLIDEAIATGLEWIIANEDEAREFTGESSSETEQIQALAGAAKYGILKLGSRGARVQGADVNFFVETQGLEAVDTTGAGDSWAAGFFAGLWHGLSPEKSVLWGHTVAAEVVQVIGAGLPKDKWQALCQFSGRM